MPALSDKLTGKSATTNDKLANSVLGYRNLKAREYATIGSSMPSLIKALVFLIVLGGLAGGGMFYPANFVEPTPKETVIRIPSKDLR